MSVARSIDPAADGNIAVRRLIIFVGGELVVLFFGYGMTAIFGIPFVVSGVAGSTLAAGAAFAWPRYCSVTYLGLGLIALLTVVAGAFSVILVVACMRGECM